MSCFARHVVVDQLVKLVLEFLGGGRGFGEVGDLFLDVI